MPRYYFNIENDSVFDDPDGLDLPDAVSARDEALGLARDLMRLQPERLEWTDYKVRVTDESGRPVLDLPFADVAR